MFSKGTRPHSYRGKLLGFLSFFSEHDEKNRKTLKNTWTEIITSVIKATCLTLFIYKKSKKTKKIEKPRLKHVTKKSETCQFFSGNSFSVHICSRKLSPRLFWCCFQLFLLSSVHRLLKWCWKLVKENKQFEIPKKLPSGSLKSTNLKMGTSVDIFGLTLLNILVLKKREKIT